MDQITCEEIARGLGRARSTACREVAANGGRGKHRAAAPARERAFAVTAAAALAAYNNVVGRHGWHDRWYVPLNVCATGAVLAAAAANGITLADIGLGPGSWRLGRAGMWWAGAAAAGWLLVATVPATRPVLGDKRLAGLDGRRVAYQAAVRIPVGTVLWEEVAFRGVLQASLRRVLPTPAAIAVTSGVFGLWHVRPTLQALRANGLGARRGRAVAGVGAGMAVTAAGGVLLSWLRDRSGGLAAPMALHLVANSGAAIAAWAVRSRQHQPRCKPWKPDTAISTNPAWLCSAERRIGPAQ